MTQESNSDRLQARDVLFTNGNCAHMVQTVPGAPIEEIIAALQLPAYDEVIVVIGWADAFSKLAEPQQARLAQLCTRGIARAAISSNALVIDGGTESGIMELMGQGVADRGHKTALIGIAPRGAVTFVGDSNPPSIRTTNDGQQVNPVNLDANHTHFVLVPGDDFGAESSMIAAIAKALIQPVQTNVSTSSATAGSQEQRASKPKGKLVNEKTALIVLVGGNPQGVTKTDILLAVRRGFPIVVLEGSGGLADQIADKCMKNPSSIFDPQLAEIVEDGNIHVFEATKTVAALEQLIVRELGANDTLQEAWRRFGAYDAKAIELQRYFNRLQPLILGLGVAVAFFIAARASLPVEYGTDGLAKVPGWLAPFGWLADFKQTLAWWIDHILYVAVLFIPILTAGLVAYAGKFNQGARWVVYRSAAEGIKRAIYIYRTRSPQFRAKPGDLPQGMAQGQAEAQLEITREMELQRRVQFISSQLMQSDANAAGLPLYEGEIPPQEKNPQKQWGGLQDDGISILAPARYLELRLDDQIKFFRKRTVTNETEYHKWQVAALIAGGLGTLLAAIGLQLWVTVTSALATMFVTYLEYRQTRMTIVHYNQTASNLENVRLWWVSLAPEEQAEEKNIKQLVEATEEVLAAEMTGWVQQMQDALGKLRVEQAKSPVADTKGAATPKPDKNQVGDNIP
jgi:hypothetical protein